MSMRLELFGVISPIDLRKKALDLKKSVEATPKQCVDLMMQKADLPLGTSVNSKIPFSTKLILGLLSVLTHHDDRSLKRSHRAENKIQLVTRSVGISFSDL